MIAKRPALAILLLMMFTSATRSQNQTTGRPYLTDPSISPDRAEIAFASGGDIWAVSSNGGDAHLLVSHPATESRPVYSPDGRKLAFISNRTGGGDIYILTFATGAVQRLTYDDGLETLDGWSRDGQWVYFTSGSHDIANMNDVYRVRAEGGTPMEFAADRYANEYFSAPSPDGSTVAITARGAAYAQWWRKGRSHLDEAEVWLVHDGVRPSYEPVTAGGAKEMWPMWAADGKALYFVSDREGAQNIWAKTLGSNAPARPITNFRDGRALWPNISYDGRTIVFEHDFEIWKLETSSSQATRVQVTRHGAPAAADVEHIAMSDGISELQLSPDGKKIAFIARGEVFAASSKDGGDAVRVTRTAQLEMQITWSPDSRRLVYASDRGGVSNLYMYDFVTQTEARLTSDPQTDHVPLFSPDGKSIAFQRGDQELRLVSPDGQQDRLLAKGNFDRPPFDSARPMAWSPDSRWLAYVAYGKTPFANVMVFPVAGGDAKPISFVANSYLNTISWSVDGKYILFDTGERTEPRQIARVDLIPRAPAFREDQFRDLFREQPSRPSPERDAQANAPDQSATEQQNSASASKDVQIVFDDIRKRISFLSTGLDARFQQISPDGKTLLLIASAAGQQNLYTFSLDELSRDSSVARQLTSTPGGKGDAQFTPDSREVVYLEQGRINAVNIDSRQTRRIAVTAEMDVDFLSEKMQVFQQAWRYLRDNFYDPAMNGVNWQNVRATYEPLIAAASTKDEMRRLLNLMVGELNASHSGILVSQNPQPVVGKLGARFDRTEYEKTGRLRIAEVFPLGPAALSGIKEGEYLTAVEKTPIASRNLDQLLSYTIGRKVDVTIASGEELSNPHDVAVRPTNQAAEKNLVYRKWVEANREYVSNESGGRLGYVHMLDMSEGALNQLYLDLDVENQSREAVVIDVRNNNGGFVNAYALDVLARQDYITMTLRGIPTGNGRVQFGGQRALGKPTILVTNQHSLSDAENFTEGYRALKVGKIVGEPTAGWLIATSNVPLIDGTVVRLPLGALRTADGKLMELNPRPVDFPVKRPVGESYSGKDSQLDRAVAELLKQLTKSSN